MRIAFCSTGEEPSSPLDLRFGRTEFFVIYDQEKNEWTSFKNAAKTEPGGAGSMAVQQLMDRQVDVAIAPELGPQALKALQGFKIPAYRQATAKTAEEALKLWKDKGLEEVKEPGNQGLHRV